MAPKLSTINVQGVVPETVHKVLRDDAYNKRIALRDLIKNVLTDYTNKVNSDLTSGQLPTNKKE